MQNKPLNEKLQTVAYMLCFQLLQHHQIAARMGVKPKTVNAYVTRLKETLGITGRFEKGVARQILIEQYGFKP